MGILLTPSPGVCRLPGKQDFEVASKSPLPPGLAATGVAALVATGVRGLEVTGVAALVATGVRGLVGPGVPGRLPAAFLPFPACVYVDVVQHKCF